MNAPGKAIVAFGGAVVCAGAAGALTTYASSDPQTVIGGAAGGTGLVLGLGAFALLMISAATLMNATSER